MDFLLALDGKTDPFSIPSPFTAAERAEILDELAGLGLIRQGRWTSRSASCMVYSLFFPERQQTRSFIPRLLNAALCVSFLPVLICGIVSFISALGTVRISAFSLSGLIAGLLAGILLHEASHAAACLAYGGKVYEAGFLLNCLVIPGAYVMMKNPDGLSTAKKIQCIAAGPEANLLLSGIGFILTVIMPVAADFFFCAALANLFLAYLNLMLRGGSDGCRILSCLFGADEEDIVDIAGKSVLNRLSRLALRRRGDVGRAALCAYSLILLFQVSTPLLILLNLLEVISWFG